MIVRKGTAPIDRRSSDDFGTRDTERCSSAGGLTQYGAYVETLQPGARTSNRHWHEREEEFLYVLSGELTVVEDDGEHLLAPGDAACWPAGVPNAHCALNRSSAPCSYLIVGTRPAHDVCRYPDLGRTLYTEGETWRLVDAQGGVVRSGRTADAG